MVKFCPQCDRDLDISELRVCTCMDCKTCGTRVSEIEEFGTSKEETIAREVTAIDEFVKKFANDESVDCEEGGRRPSWILVIDKPLETYFAYDPSRLGTVEVGLRSYSVPKGMIDKSVDVLGIAHGLGLQIQGTIASQISVNGNKEDFLWYGFDYLNLSLISDSLVNKVLERIAQQMETVRSLAASS